MEEELEPKIDVPLKCCIHITSADAIPSIMSKGLLPMIGPLSEQAGEQAGIFMFPSWNDMHDANWLFDEAWPHDSEPALIAVDTSGLEMESEAGFEVVVRTAIPAERITVLAPTEENWHLAKARFIEMGGYQNSLVVKLKQKAAP